MHRQEAKAKQEKVSAQYLSEIEMAKAQRDYELKKAAYDIEVNTRRAQADLAYQLQVGAAKRPFPRLSGHLLFSSSELVLVLLM